MTPVKRDKHPGVCRLQLEGMFESLRDTVPLGVSSFTSRSINTSTIPNEPAAEFGLAHIPSCEFFKLERQRERN